MDSPGQAQTGTPPPEDDAKSLAHRLLAYVIIAIAVILLTVSIILLPEGLPRFRLGFESLESILDTTLLALAGLLLILSLIQVIIWLRQREGAPLTSPSSGSEEVVMALDGQVLRIMDSTMKVPETLRSMTLHVLEEHGEDLTKVALNMQSRSRGEDLGGANWLLAFLEIMNAHVDEARTDLLQSMVGGCSSLMASRLRGRRG